MLSSSSFSSASIPLTDIELGMAARFIYCVLEGEVGVRGENEPIDCETGMLDGRELTRTNSSSFATIPVGIECIESEVAMLSLGEDSADA